MKAVLLVVGKTINPHFLASIKDYNDRINHYMSFDFVTIPEIKNTKNIEEQVQKEKEGEQILRQLQPSDYVVLMDEHGSEMRSMEYSKWLQHKMNIVKRLVFIIGGPYGFSDSIYKRADDKVSLSKMTFSHQMVRLIFVEQLYRACTILKGEPYHHE